MMDNNEILKNSSFIHHSLSHLDIELKNNPQRKEINRIRTIVRHLYSSEFSNKEYNDSQLYLCAVSNKNNHQLPTSTLHNSEIQFKKERKQLTFNIRIMENILNGGKINTLNRKKAESLVESDKILRDDEHIVNDLSRKEARELSMRKVLRFNKFLKENKDKEGIDQDYVEWVSKIVMLYDDSLSMRYGVHSLLFSSSIYGQGTKEQIEEYEQHIKDMSVIGSFAMTELGTGSYIQQFETTSIYDLETDEFIINTPTTTATKWWMGMVAHAATHTIVFAQLIIGKHKYGVHSFIVPLRNLHTGETLSGVKIGDLGPKWGRKGLDNGYIQFNNVRIPRTNMLMKWAQVKRGGEYCKPPIPQLAYGALIGGRVFMIQSASWTASKALTIATRYSVVRRQWGVASSNGDDLGFLIDLESHQRILLSNIATAYASHFTGQKMNKEYTELTERLKYGSIAGLREFHANSSGLKAWLTWWCYDTIEQSRRCCGGHGYTMYSGLPELQTSQAVLITGEGDNIVMAQQMAKFLMSSYQKALGGKLNHKEYSSVEYLLNLSDELENKKLKVTCIDELFNFNLEISTYEYISKSLIQDAAMHFHSELSNGNDKRHAWNESMMDMVECSKAHSYLLLTRGFIEFIEEKEKKGKIEKGEEDIISILKLLAHYFAWYNIEHEFLVPLLENGYIIKETILIIRKAIRYLEKQLRINILGLVDSFGHPDFTLRTVLGNKEGNLYENYINFVDIMNEKVGDTINGKPPYWSELISPLTNKI